MGQALSLTDQLGATDTLTRFHRPAIAAVFDEYAAFIETGKYPYNDDVVTFIAERAGITLNGTHHAQHIQDPIGEALHHEVYLASGQWKVRTMRATEANYIADGYDSPITALTPKDGLRIEIADIPPVLRCKFAGSDWALCLPRKQSGFSLNRLIERHRAYERAKVEGQIRGNDPRVVMYRVAER